jgi:3''-phosphoadenosine 5''-phosphosulfate sulfotransferase (PAPS reductase)/FAD synthetase and related enzymes
MGMWKTKVIHSYRELKELQELPLEDKTFRAEQIILYNLKTHNHPCIACSWGKDSMVLLHLVRKFCEKAIVMFNNTGVQYPQNLEYRDRILKEWNIENYIENKPIKSFWVCVKQYGFPKARQMGKGKKGEKARPERTPKCCYYCKEGPAKKAIRKYGIDLNFVGLQASESMVRRLSFFREGETFKSKTYGCTIVRPLMIWRDKDVWEYHKVNEIPRNKVYDLMERNGCMPCTGFKSWREVMARANPKLYSYVSKELGQPLLSDCKEFWG